MILTLPQNITDQISSYNAISLSEMDSVKLMDRFDFKLLFELDKLNIILRKLKPYYRVLEINSNRLSLYDNIYYDTAGKQFYLEHHNQKANRLKVRYRTYVDSGITFFEVKQKNNKGKTIKERISVRSPSNTLGNDEKLLLQNFIPTSTINSLIPSLNNSFRRLTLVNNNYSDRLTFDLFTTFQFNGQQTDINHMVIAELKQSAHVLDAFKRQLFKDEKIYTVSLSKYIIGSLMLNSALKHNNFKEKLLFINKHKHVA